MRLMAIRPKAVSRSICSIAVIARRSMACMAIKEGTLIGVSSRRRTPSDGWLAECQRLHVCEQVSKALDSCQIEIRADGVSQVRMQWLWRRHLATESFAPLFNLLQNSYTIRRFCTLV